MADKRKPVFVFLLRIPGTKFRHKIELFDGQLYTGHHMWTDPDTRRWKTAGNRFRVRCDGKWVGAKGKGKGVKLFTWYEFRDLLWRSIPQQKIKEIVNDGRRTAREQAKKDRGAR